MTYDTGYTFTSKRAVQRLEKVTSALQNGGLTRAQIAKLTFMSDSVTNLYLRHLKNNGLIYIASWANAVPVYVLGSKDDAVCPRRTRAQQYAIDKKNKPDRRAKKLANDRKKYWEKRDASKLVGIDRRSPPLATEVENYVIANRRKTSSQIAKAVDAKLSTVSTILLRLVKDGKVRNSEQPGSRRKWESATHNLLPILNIPKQSIFSALGL